MGKQTSTGVKLWAVAGSPATEDKAGYEALTWVAVADVVDLPAYGPTTTVVESKPLATGITEKYPGFTNNGSLALGLDQNITDAGQILLEGLVQKAGVIKPMSVRIDFVNGKSDYFKGGVFSFTTNIGSADSMIGATCQVEINSDVLRETSKAP